jgi:hypothetical protein
MTEKIVHTKEELQQAMDDGVTTIVVEGSFAKDLKKTKKVATSSKYVIAAIVAIAGTAPFTGGMSALALAPVVALSGIEIAIIVLTVSVGIGLIVAVYKGYDEISYSSDPYPRIVLRRKTSD